MKPINLSQKLSTFTEHWQPRTVGGSNGHGKHKDTDDFFLVLKWPHDHPYAPR